VTRVLEGFLLQ